MEKKWKLLLLLFNCLLLGGVVINVVYGAILWLVIILGALGVIFASVAMGFFFVNDEWESYIIFSVCSVLSFLGSFIIGNPAGFRCNEKGVIVLEYQDSIRVVQCPTVAIPFLVNFVVLDDLDIHTTVQLSLDNKRMVVWDVEGTLIWIGDRAIGLNLVKSFESGEKILEEVRERFNKILVEYIIERYKKTAGYLPMELEFSLAEDQLLSLKEVGFLVEKVVVSNGRIVKISAN
jgi:hypothetical protein